MKELLEVQILQVHRREILYLPRVRDLVEVTVAVVVVWLVTVRRRQVVNVLPVTGEWLEGQEEITLS